MTDIHYRRIPSPRHGSRGHGPGCGVLGHIQRGGSPSPCDCVLGTRVGARATELIANHDFGKMVRLRGESVMGVDIAKAVGHLKLVDPNGELVATAPAMGICFGD